MVIVGRFPEQAAHASIAFRSERRLTQPAEGEREVGAIRVHGPQEIAPERRVTFLFDVQPELAP